MIAHERNSATLGHCSRRYGVFPLRHRRRIRRVEPNVVYGMHSGIGRTLASREANSPECQQLVAEFVSDEHH